MSELVKSLTPSAFPTYNWYPTKTEDPWPQNGYLLAKKSGKSALASSIENSGPPFSDKFLKPNSNSA